MSPAAVRATSVQRNDRWPTGSEETDGGSQLKDQTFNDQLVVTFSLTITDMLDHQSAAAEIRCSFLWGSEEPRRRRVLNELHPGSRSALITDI